MMILHQQKDSGGLALRDFRFILSYTQEYEPLVTLRLVIKDRKGSSSRGGRDLMTIDVRCQIEIEPRTQPKMAKEEKA